MDFIKKVCEIQNIFDGRARGLEKLNFKKKEENPKCKK